MSEQLRVHQALFGYREGHNLLTASVALTPRVRHFLATITDSSGAEAAEGFDCAFTGLPVPETDYYALFCTWPAPEMPRPGCVWSHVLLIELADLAQIADFTSLRKLCRRPSSSSQGFTDYTNQLLADGSKTVPYESNPMSQWRASMLLTALYEKPESSIVVLDTKSSHCQEIIFAIWSQQWPRLRRNFAFSTGSLGDRRLAGVAFDLQVAPLSSERLWRRGGPSTFVLDMLTKRVEQPSIPNWMSIVLDDLEKGATSPLREFLFSYGSDLERPRKAFASLVNAYISLKEDSNKDWPERLRSVAAMFPVETDAVRLKQWLVTPCSTVDSQQDFERAWLTAAFLLSCPEANAYAKVPFDHGGLAPYLWDRKKDEVLTLMARLVRQEENPSATAFAVAVGKSVKPGELQNISYKHPELISIFISQRTELAHDVNVWKLPSHIQTQIFEVLDGLSLSELEWGKIMGAMFLAATFVFVRSAVKKAGSHAIQGAFRWLDDSIAQEFLPSQAWRDALMESAADRLANENPLAPAQLAFSSWFVSPDDIRKCLSASRKDVQQLGEKSLDIIPPPLRSHTAFLLVTLGLRAKTSDGVRLLSRGYFDVYNVLAESRATSEEWALLSPELPRLGRWGDWDRCERLRRAVRNWLFRYAKHGNPLREAAITQEQQNIAQQIHALDNDTDENDKFLD
jgi:hypothetical protein